MFQNACSLWSQAEAFQSGWLTAFVLSDQQELTIVRHQHQTIALPILAHLRGCRQSEQLVLERLYLDHATFGDRACARRPLLQLFRREQAEVRLPAADVSKLRDAKDLGFERRADRVQQILQGTIE